jgi:hypothetical protein
MARVEFDYRNNQIPKGFSLVTREGKTYLRRKGGASKERIMNDPALARVKQNAQEFADLSKLSKALFDITAPFTKGIRDSRTYFRLVGLLNKVKKHNAIFESSQKTALTSMATDIGRQLMTGFNFNDKIPLFENFSPKTNLKESENALILNQITTPSGIAKHTSEATFTIIMGRVCIDKQSGQCTLDLTNQINIRHNQNIEPMEFTFSTTPPENSIRLYLCLVQFYIESSGKIHSSTSLPGRQKQGLNGSCAIIHAT